MEINRDRYLKQLIRRKHNLMFKVVTGIHGCGKSYLLFTQFYRHLIETGTSPDHIITLDMEDPGNAQYCKPANLYAYLTHRITNEKDHYYVLIDEVQRIEHFDMFLINLLYQSPNADIYVTCSNTAYCSLKDYKICSYRVEEIRMYPLSFSEYLIASAKPRVQAYEEYARFGGLPFICSCETDEEKQQYLSSLFRDVYLPELRDRYTIYKTEMLEDLIDIFSSSVGSLMNPRRIAEAFASERHTVVSEMTMKKYLEALEAVYLVNGLKRFEIRRGRYVSTPRKYYFEDIGLRSIRLAGSLQKNEDYTLENIVCNELRFRGYEVETGFVDKTERDETGKAVHRNREIDFIVRQGDKVYYIQVASALADAEEERQMKKALLSVDDSFKKIIVTRDYSRLRREEKGILTLGILDFLLDEASLDL